jgi:hypothetical protein
LGYGESCGRCYFSGPLIGAVGVDRDLDEPPARQSGLVVVIVVVRVHVLDLDAAVVTAVAADAVGTAWLMALRALCERRSTDLVL